MYSIAIPDVRLTFGRYFFLALRFTLKTNPGMWLLGLPLLGSVTIVYGLCTNPTAAWKILQGPQVVFALMPLILAATPFQMWRRYRRTPLLHGSTSFGLSDAGLKVHNEVFNTHLQWEVMRRAYTFGDWMVLTTGEQQGFFLNLQHVQAPYAADNVRRLLLHHDIEVR